MLDNTPHQPTKFRTKNLVEINDESRKTYNKDNQIRFKTSVFMTSFCDYSDAYIPVKGTITVAQATGATPITWINNTQVNDTQYTDVVMPMHNFI